MKNKKIAVFSISLLLVTGTYFGWKKWSGDSTEMVAGQTLGGKPSDGKNKPISVTTVIAQKRNYAVKLTANGIVTALNVVEVRPQVSNIIAKVHIKEGQFVHAGDVLFTLDSRVDTVNLAKVQAQMDKELASLAEHQRQLARSKELFEKKFQSQSAVDASQTVVQAQQAVVDAARAAVGAAKLNLAYNRILAPASGRTGLINVFTGSLVQPGTSGAPLVTITQMDPIAIAFPLPQRNLSDALASMRRADSFALASLPDSAIKLKGKLQFVDSAVDAASGTVKLKAVFANKEMKLWPGAYANIELSVLTLKDVVVVPQEALVIGVDATSVFVVDAANNAEKRKVQVQTSAGGEAVISGVESGTKIIVEGKQNLRPGVSVKERSVEESSKSDLGTSKKKHGDAATSAASAK